MRRFFARMVAILSALVILALALAFAAIQNP
jgi:hypothetical protein